jgi:hypothetical protein
MGLSFGWRAQEVRESFWIDDPDLANVPQAARDEWQETGDAAPLRPFIKPGGTPSPIVFRALTPDEARTVTSLLAGATSNTEAAYRSWLLCFRIGASFPACPAILKDEKGAEHEMVVRERGLRMLANEFVAALDKAWPGLSPFYGRLIFDASFLDAAEKKASSPPSTPTKSDDATA